MFKKTSLYFLIVVEGAERQVRLVDSWRQTSANVAVDTVGMTRHEFWRRLAIFGENGREVVFVGGELVVVVGGDVFVFVDSFVSAEAALADAIELVDRLGHNF